MLRVLDSEEETDKRVFTFPTSQIRLQGRKSSYFDVIHSLKFPECCEALVRVVKNTDMNAINELIMQTALISETRKAFLWHIIQKRYEKILLSSYRLLTQSGGAS